MHTLRSGDPAVFYVNNVVELHKTLRQVLAEKGIAVAEEKDASKAENAINVRRGDFDCSLKSLLSG